MLEQPILTIMRESSQEVIDQQSIRWLEISAHVSSIIGSHNISGMTIEEAIASTVEEIRHFHFKRVAFESFTTVADNVSDAIQLATAILEIGARLYVVTYAGWSSMMEIDMETLKFFSTLNSVDDMDDLLFYARHSQFNPVTLNDIFEHLVWLERSLEYLSKRIPPRYLMVDVRRIAMMVSKLKDAQV